MDWWTTNTIPSKKIATRLDPQIENNIGLELHIKKNNDGKPADARGKTQRQGDYWHILQKRVSVGDDSQHETAGRHTRCGLAELLAVCDVVFRKSKTGNAKNEREYK